MKVNGKRFHGMGTSTRCTDEGLSEQQVLQETKLRPTIDEVLQTEQLLEEDLHTGRALEAILTEEGLHDDRREYKFAGKVDGLEWIPDPNEILEEIFDTRSIRSCG